MAWLGLALVLAALVPMSWLPETRQSSGLISAFLQAQAAFIALALVVIVFLLESIRARPDLDDDIFAEILRRLQLIRVFQAGLVMVVVTSLALVVAQPAPSSAAWASTVYARASFLVALIALVVTLAMVGVMFAGMLGIMAPTTWRGLRREVLAKLTRAALAAYLARIQRFSASEHPDLALAFASEPPERRADTAIGTLIADGQRAFNEKRLTDFREVFRTLEAIASVAMDEIQAAGVQFSDPTTLWSAWPPLQSISTELYSLRAEVARGGWTDYAYELSRFDTWMVQQGSRRLAGEVLEAGLVGFEHTYRLALSSGDRQYIDVVRPRLWRLVRDGLYELLRRPAGDDVRVVTSPVASFCSSPATSRPH